MTAPRGDRSFLPLTIWLATSMLPLALAAARIPLSANYPRPAESNALYLLVITQLAISALLFPLLLSNWRLMLVITIASYPFIFLAGFLAFSPVVDSVWCVAGLTLWLMVLSALRPFLTTIRTQLIAVSVAALLIMGTAILVYVAKEFSR
jgi:hypothetical protein